MNAVILVANPNAASFSHAMAEAATVVLSKKHYAIHYHDLYAENFQPIQPTGESKNTSSADPLVEQHCDEIEEADLILIFHPNWWGQPPAILKGWIDRVLRLGTAYDYPPNVGFDGVPKGLLKARSALVFNTSNTPWEREEKVFGNPLENLWKVCVFDLCGVKVCKQRMFCPVSTSTPSIRAGWLNDVQSLVEQHA